MTPQITPFTNPAGLELKVQTLSPEEAKFLLKLTLIECAIKDAKKDLIVPEMEAEMDWPLKAVRKRIEVMKLPVTFTSCALLSFMSFTKVIGGCITILIDACHKFPEGTTVTIEDMCNMYPFGWYTEDSFEYYVDNHLKPKTTKWAGIY